MVIRIKSIKKLFMQISTLCLCLVISQFGFTQYEFDEELDDTTGEFELFGAIQLRADMVRDLPRPIENDFERGTARGIIGIRWSPTEIIELGVAAKANLSTQSNKEVRFNLDNERADDVSIDEFYVKLVFSENTQVTIGQSIFPLELSPMIWDEDLRPQGISINHIIDIGQFNSLEFTAGSFLANHLFGDDTKINALQTAFRFGQGKNMGFDFIASYIDYSDIDDLGRRGLGRTNFLDADRRHRNDFNLLDLQFGLHLNQHTFPISAKLNLVDNLAVGKKSFGARVDLIFGDSFQQQGVEFGFAAQRVQYEAVLAAFNDDDWWFASGMRGSTAWLSYGFSDSLRMRLAGFDERYDRAPKHNKRLLLDLQWFY